MSTSCLASTALSSPRRPPKWYWTALALVAPPAAVISRRLTESDPRSAKRRSAARISASATWLATGAFLVAPALGARSCTRAQRRAGTGGWLDAGQGGDHLGGRAREAT